VFSARASASGVVAYGPLPDPKDDVAFTEEVQRRTNALRMGIQRVESSLGAETATREKAVSNLQRQLDDQHDRLRDMAQQAAVSGLPLEMTGIFFVIVGTVLQGIAQLIK
jgi:hypothetical protein